MKKKLIIELDGQWVLQHREDELLPIAAIESELNKLGVFECSEGSLTSLVVLFDEDAIGDEAVLEKLAAILSDKYPREDLGNILSVQIEGGEESGNAALPQIERKEPKKGAEPQENRAQIALNKIDALVGAAEFKALAREIADVAPEIRRTGAYEVFFNRCYLFSIGDGRGLTTYLSLLA